MTDYTLNLVDAIISGKATDIETAFQEAISDKISIAMETKRTEIAQGMFKESVFDDARKKQSDDEKKGVDPDKEYKLRMKSAQNTQRVNKALTKEEVEQLDEISAEKIVKYSEKSNKEYNDPSTSDEKKVVRRKGLMTGYNKLKARAKVPATSESLEDYSLEELEDFMMSEDFEQLDELSKKTLGSYVKKATSDVGLAGFVKGTTVNDHSRSKDYEDAAAMNKKRKVGIAKAVDKLTKEEIDLEEAVTASQLIANHNSSDHGGAQHFSNVDGKHHSWNYVKKNKEGTKYEVTTDKSEAEGIAHKGKFLKMPK